MADHATPTLPARDLDATAAFYAGLGFVTSYRDSAWMILERGGLVLEFFPDADVDPATTAAGCCLRVDDLDTLYAGFARAGVPEHRTGWPRLHPPRVEDSGMRIGHLVDLDGTLAAPRSQNP